MSWQSTIQVARLTSIPRQDLKKLANQPNTQVAPPTAASIVANGVKANGSAKAAPEPEPAAEDKPASVEDEDTDAAKPEAKEDGEEEVRCGAV